MNQRPIEILLVEDDQLDAQLTIEALRDAQIPNQIHLVKDGEQALQFVRREPPFTDAPRPDFILLDLHLPKVEGTEVLAALKGDDNLKDIPVIVVSTSSSPRDIRQAYKSQVSCYITKPSNPDDYFSAIRSLKEMWFYVVTLPPASQNGLAG